jgi:ABC-2 type transport system ATP-binding protein
MTVYGFLSFAAELRGMRGEERKRAVHRVVETCFLDAVLHQSVDTLSKGFRHRTCFAQSILHDPDVLIMDEPTDGLDPNQKHEVRQLIRRMGEKKAIVFSTHILEEVEAACTRAIIIDRGQIVANGTPEELKQRSAVAGAVLVRAAGVPVATLAARIGQLPTARKTVPATDRGHGEILRVFPQAAGRDGALAREVAELAAREGWKLEELHTEEGRLDEVFRSITQPETSRGGN